MKVPTMSFLLLLRAAQENMDPRDFIKVLDAMEYAEGTDRFHETIFEYRREAQKRLMEYA